MQRRSRRPASGCFESERGRALVRGPRQHEKAFVQMAREDGIAGARRAIRMTDELALQLGRGGLLELVIAQAERRRLPRHAFRDDVERFGA